MVPARSSLTLPCGARVALVLGLATLACTGRAGAGPDDLALLPPALGTTEVVASGRAGLGFGGYDPVAFLLDGTSRAGSAEHELVWAGIAWRFTGEANRAAFRRDPDSFAPRLGGYDALGAAEGLLVEADPRVAARVDDRVYLFRTEARRRLFLADRAAPARAEAGWAAVRPGLVRD